MLDQLRSRTVRVEEQPNRNPGGTITNVFKWIHTHSSFPVYWSDICLSVTFMLCLKFVTNSWRNPQWASLFSILYPHARTHVVPLGNVLLDLSLLGTFLKAACHPQRFQENNLTRGQPKIWMSQTYHAPRHAVCLHVVHNLSGLLEFSRRCVVGLFLTCCSMTSLVDEGCSAPLCPALTGQMEIKTS